MVEIMQNYKMNVGDIQFEEINVVQVGKYEMVVPHCVHFPEKFRIRSKLYVCRFCLEHTYSLFASVKHEMECTLHGPPGVQIYCKDDISIFEIDGLNQMYCQNLCSLARLFVQEKQLYYDVKHFLLYVMIKMEKEGYEIIGYFSKSKEHSTIYNVSDILVFPSHQKQGFGRMLIDFSYLLSKREGKVGTPELPLSQLGMIAYGNYWKSVLMEYMGSHMMDTLTIEGMKRETAMMTSDIIATLEEIKCLKYRRGKHIVLRRTDLIEQYMEKSKKRRNDRIIDPSCLMWNPKILPDDLEGGLTDQK